MKSYWIFVHVRPGFERDCQEELQVKFEVLNVRHRFSPAIEGSGFLTCEIEDAPLQDLSKSLIWKDLIFARQLLWSIGSLDIPLSGDRVSPLLAAVKSELIPLSGGNAFSGFNVEPTDADETKTLSGFCKSLSRPIENGLNKLKLLPKGKGAAHLPSLTLVMVDPQRIWPCIALKGNSAPWDMGIPRLKFPQGAPSRSTLKLDEAFITFLGEQSQIEVRPGMTAVDLGSSPGGWTFQLVQRGLKVAAVDNGPMDPALMASGLVDHYKEDAFHFKPTRPVDWLVCDVVERPSLITNLIGLWISSGWTKKAIFNLKLPMKSRYAEIKSCLSSLKSDCEREGIKVTISCKQLYHDRKEVTVFVRGIES